MSPAAEVIPGKSSAVAAESPLRFQSHRLGARVLFNRQRDASVFGSIKPEHDGLSTSREPQHLAPAEQRGKMPRSTITTGREECHTFPPACLQPPGPRISIPGKLAPSVALVAVLALSPVVDLSPLSRPD